MNSRFVGVTAGLGTPRTSSWTGSRNTAPETPTGAVTVAMTSPATNPNSSRSNVTWLVSFCRVELGWRNCQRLLGADHRPARRLPASGIPPYPRAVTVEELGQELGVDAADLAVMLTTLGERVDDELRAGQAADLLDVLDAKVRLRR